MSTCKVKLLVPRVGLVASQAAGTHLDVDPVEARRMIDAGQAELIEGELASVEESYPERVEESGVPADVESFEQTKQDAELVETPEDGDQDADEEQKPARGRRRATKAS